MEKESKPTRWGFSFDEMSIFKATNEMRKLFPKDHYEAITPEQWEFLLKGKVHPDNCFEVFFKIPETGAKLGWMSGELVYEHNEHQVGEVFFIREGIKRIPLHYLRFTLEIEGNAEIPAKKIYKLMREISEEKQFLGIGTVGEPSFIIEGNGPAIIYESLFYSISISTTRTWLDKIAERLDSLAEQSFDAHYKCSTPDTLPIPFSRLFLHV